MLGDVAGEELKSYIANRLSKQHFRTPLSSALLMRLV